jgi:hypothetical protein
MFWENSTQANMRSASNLEIFPMGQPLQFSEQHAPTGHYASVIQKLFVLELRSRMSITGVNFGQGAHHGAARSCVPATHFDRLPGAKLKSRWQISG